MAISLNEIAELAKTSKSTVSRALQNSPLIGEETRSKIFKIASELGYVPDEVRSNHARNLRPVRARTVAKRTNIASLVFFKQSRERIWSIPYFRDLTGHVHEVFRSGGLSLTESYPQSDEECFRLLDVNTADGTLILSSVEKMDENFSSRLRFYSNGKPLVFLSNYPAAYENVFHNVRADDIGVGRMAARHGFALGHGTIIYVDPCYGKAVHEDRYFGYKMEMEDKGREPVRLRFDHDRYVSTGLCGLEGATNLPDGNNIFLCGTDSSLFPFVDFLKKEGVYEASRMHFIGMDGIPDLAADDVRSATVKIDLENMARQAFHLFNDILDGKVSKPKSILVGCELMTRENL